MNSMRPEPSEIEYKSFRFLITDRPTDSTISRFVEELQRRRAPVVVRVCEPTYDTAILHDNDIPVVDLAFDDGSSPSSEIINQWLSVVKETVLAHPSACVAVHCVAGLGRAPVLVAIALIELGMRYEDAVAMIREKRRGAINAKQLTFLEKYKPKSRLRLGKNGKGNGKCLIQ